MHVPSLAAKAVAPKLGVTQVRRVPLQLGARSRARQEGGRHELRKLPKLEAAREFLQKPGVALGCIGNLIPVGRLLVCRAADRRILCRLASAAQIVLRVPFASRQRCPSSQMPDTSEQQKVDADIS